MKPFNRTTSFSEKRESKNKIQQVIQKREQLMDFNKTQNISFNQEVNVILYKKNEPASKNIKTYKQPIKNRQSQIITKKLLKIYTLFMYPYIINKNVLYDKKLFWENVYDYILFKNEKTQENYKQIAKKRLIGKIDELIEKSKVFSYTNFGYIKIPLYLVITKYINKQYVLKEFPKKKITKKLIEFKKFILSE